MGPMGTATLIVLERTDYLEIFRTGFDQADKAAFLLINEKFIIG
jgi:hypothetical protein